MINLNSIKRSSLHRNTNKNCGLNGLQAPHTHFAIQDERKNLAFFGGIYFAAERDTKLFSCRKFSKLTLFFLAAYF